MSCKQRHCEAGLASTIDSEHVEEEIEWKRELKKRGSYRGMIGRQVVFINAEPSSTTRNVPGM